MKEIHVVSTDILEWYDGFVSGILTHDTGRMWGAMIAFYPDTLRRVYAFMDISKETEAAICSKISIDGLDDLDTLRIEFFSSPYIFTGNVLVGERLEIVAAPSDLFWKIKNVKFPCIESSIDDPLC